MKILLDIPDNKANSLLEVLKSISYVKVKPLTDSKTLLTNEIKDAVKELNLVKKGKLKGIPIEDLLNDL